MKESKRRISNCLWKPHIYFIDIGSGIYRPTFNPANSTQSKFAKANKRMEDFNKAAFTFVRGCKAKIQEGGG